jgi:hypothetical protein
VTDAQSSMAANLQQPWLYLTTPGQEQGQGDTIRFSTKRIVAACTLSSGLQIVA